ncbi:MAG: hypothetical protein JNL80_13550 [Phycisphaerae bacterium]|jgi:uncharacterized membrane protein|nr:hypothetical protein [Phycisphaerae bacterium]
MPICSRLLSVGLAASAFSSVASAERFTLTYVGHFPPAVTEAMNASGRIAGDFQYQGVTTAMRYQHELGGENGRVPLPVPPGTTQSLAIGINDAGTCVGRLSPPSGPSLAAIWSPTNELTQLPMPPGTWSYNTASGINAAGTVCGAVTFAQVGIDPQQAWRWTARGGYEMLPKLTGTDALAWDINASGEVVGRADLSNNSYRMVIWGADGVIHNLGLVAGSTQTFGVANNDAGQAVGTTNANTDAILYTPGVGLVKLPDLGFKAAAFDINNEGWILGWADSAPFETVPVVWGPDGVLHNIASLAEAAYPGRFYFPGDYLVPIAIGDNNWIAVRGMDFTVSGDPRVLLFELTVAVPCLADLNGDGSVGAEDLAVLLGAWGENPGSPADLSGDGAVSAADLALLLGAWGPC